MECLIPIAVLSVIVSLILKTLKYSHFIQTEMDISLVTALELPPPPEMTKINLCLRHFTHCLKINMLQEYRLKFMQGHKHFLVINRA